MDIRLWEDSLETSRKWLNSMITDLLGPKPVVGDLEILVEESNLLEVLQNDESA